MRGKICLPRHEASAGTPVTIGLRACPRWGHLRRAPLGTGEAYREHLRLTRQGGRRVGMGCGRRALPEGLLDWPWRCIERAFDDLTTPLPR